MTSVAVSVPLAVYKSSENIWLSNDFLYKKYTNQQVEEFRKDNEPKTEYVNFDMSRNRDAPKTLLTHNQRFMLLFQIHQESTDLIQFINNNNNNIKAIYKHVYTLETIDPSTSQVSCIDISKNVQTLPENLQNFSNQLKDKIASLKNNVSTLISFSPNLMPSSLYTYYRYWFDANYYYLYGTDLNNLSNTLNNRLGVLDGVDQTGENISDAGDAMADTGNEIMDTFSVISKILGSILEIAGFIGKCIVNNIMHTVNIAQQEWKGVTTHWLFGFIYVGTSVGKSIWWGA